MVFSAAMPCENKIYIFFFFALDGKGKESWVMGVYYALLCRPFALIYGVGGSRHFPHSGLGSGLGGIFTTGLGIIFSR